MTRRKTQKPIGKFIAFLFSTMLLGGSFVQADDLADFIAPWIAMVKSLMSCSRRIEVSKQPSAFSNAI